MILSKYTDIKGKDIIFNSRLKVSNPSDFNDPFEFALQLIKFTPTDIKRLVFKDKEILRKYFDSASQKGKINKSWKDFKNIFRSLPIEMRELRK